jgi:hypothetical protein
LRGGQRIFHDYKEISLLRLKVAGTRSKYYIGNGNCAALVLTFAKIADTGEYSFLCRTHRSSQLRMRHCDGKRADEAYLVSGMKKKLRKLLPEC